MINKSPWKGNIWGLTIPIDKLTPADRDYLHLWSNRKIPPIDEIWKEMDTIWDSLELDNSVSLNEQKIDTFYSHPVWMLNGLFTEYDPESSNHREAIANKISTLAISKIADFGGGFGALARQLLKISPKIEVDIIESYPSVLGKQLISNIPQSRFIPRPTGKYDCAIAQDVLEHIEDPIGLVYEIAQATIENGYLLFANCFKPVIKCHLPATFHLRHTFNWVVEPLGLNYCGNVEGAEHVHIFQMKHENSNLQACRKRETLSKKIDPWFNLACAFIRKLKHVGVGKKI
ncbi:MAG: class I SAM-dependent methyltransferase [Desulfobacterales bacterium]|nr:class I SAM-dependent methyltransferase [Desulfobacterales bacterium]